MQWINLKRLQKKAISSAHASIATILILHNTPLFLSKSSCHAAPLIGTKHACFDKKLAIVDFSVIFR